MLVLATLIGLVSESAAQLCRDTCAHAGDGSCDDGAGGSATDLCTYGTDCRDCGSRALPGADSDAICENTCPYAQDGSCDDGGPDAPFSLCVFGTDCNDCGPRARQASATVQPLCALYDLDATAVVQSLTPYVDLTPSEAEAIMSEIGSVVYLPNPPVMLIGEVPNASAMLQQFEGQYRRIIVYNDDFVEGLRAVAGPWAVVFVLSHELGHHYAGHTVEGGYSTHEREYEADAFAAQVMYLMGAPLGDVVSALEALPLPNTASHPGSAERVAAIEAFYSELSSLGVATLEGAADADPPEGPGGASAFTDPSWPEMMDSLVLVPDAELARRILIVIRSEAEGNTWAWPREPLVVAIQSTGTLDAASSHHFVRVALGAGANDDCTLEELTYRVDLKDDGSVRSIVSAGSGNSVEVPCAALEYLRTVPGVGLVEANDEESDEELDAR